MEKDKRITIEPCTGTLSVRAGVTLLAQTTNALVLRETGYGPRFYIPAADVRIAQLRPSDKVTSCPYKGEAEYFHAETADGLLPDIAWSYPAPLPDVAAISGHIAFYEEQLEVSLT